jgi:hypothetical protein
VLKLKPRRRTSPGMMDMKRLQSLEDVYLLILRLLVSKPHMRILVDEATNIRFVRWFETKDGMVGPTCATLYQWSTKGRKTLFIRCDGAGENHSLETMLHSSEWKMPIEFEYTARNTPQQNHLAEIGIYVICCQGRALMSRANSPRIYRY